MSAAKSYATDQSFAFRARWVAPVDRPPICGGVVTIAGGRIVAVGAGKSSQAVMDLGDVVLVPGFVNAHTHLEFSQLERPLGAPGMAFPEWIRHVVAWRRKIAAPDSAAELAQRAAFIQRGLLESRAAGVSALGDIASLPCPLTAYATCPEIYCTVFGELLGLAADRAVEAATRADDFVRAELSAADNICRALSPHAPYTVHPELLQTAVRLAAECGATLAMHLAESREELQLLYEQRGPFVEALQSLAAWNPAVLPRGLRPLDYLQILTRAKRALIVHGNYLAAAELEFLSAHRDRLSLVYCPRTHAYFRHDAYPLSQALAAGVRVAVGTDSRASNPDLSLLSELRHIAQHHPVVSPDTILRMGTLWGAEALGVAAALGSLTPGKRAEIAVVPLPDANTQWEAIFFADAAQSSVRRLEDWQQQFFPSR